MALDVGKVRVGVALSDPLGYTAQPLLTLWRSRSAQVSSSPGGGKMEASFLSKSC